MTKPKIQLFMALPSLQFFADPFEEFDLQEFDKQYRLENEPEPETDADADPQGEELPELDDAEITGEDEVQVEETHENYDGDTDEAREKRDNPKPDLDNAQKRDAAFAALRRERDEAARKAAFIEQFAAENGMTVEELQKNYQERKLAQEAEQQGVPVDVLKRLKSVEMENQQIKEQAQMQTFNQQVNSTLEKYNGTPENFEATLQYAAENGLIDALKGGAITFEAAYKLAHMDTLIETTKKAAVQENLATRKRRQQEATIPAGGAADVPADFDESVKKDAAAIIAEYGF